MCVETTIREIRLPAETVHVVLLPAKLSGRGHLKSIFQIVDSRLPARLVRVTVVQLAEYSKTLSNVPVCYLTPF